MSTAVKQWSCLEEFYGSIKLKSEKNGKMKFVVKLKEFQSFHGIPLESVISNFKGVFTKHEVTGTVKSINKVVITVEENEAAFLRKVIKLTKKLMYISIKKSGSTYTIAVDTHYSKVKEVQKEISELFKDEGEIVGTLELIPRGDFASIKVNGNVEIQVVKNV